MFTISRLGFRSVFKNRQKFVQIVAVVVVVGMVLTVLAGVLTS